MKNGYTRLGASLLLAAAFVGTVVAFISRHALCLDGDHPSCLEGEPEDWHLIGQQVAAVIGLIAAAGLLYSVTRGRRTAAIACLAIGLIAFGAWGWMLDVATHPG